MMVTQAEAVHYQAGSEFLPVIEEVNNLNQPREVSAAMHGA
jgi:hypothetical protein